MSEKYILVTGGAGYIGSHTCKALSKAGYTPVTFDNLSTGSLTAVKWGPLIQGDLLDINKLNKTFLAYKFEGVVHFAAKAYVGESVSNPLKYFEGNVSTTVNLLKSMQVANVNKLVFSSSCATYGETHVATIAEDQLQVPVNPYGYTKLVCERMIKYQADTHPFRYSILRYFNAAGADPQQEIGENHSPETHLIPLALRAAMERKIFKVFGNDYETPDGTAIRDYIHVSDLASSHVIALKKLFLGSDSFTCNIGTGTGYSVLEVMEGLKKLFPKFRFEYTVRRPGDPAKLVANVQKSIYTLDFKPVYSNLETILETALAWEKSKEIG